MGAWLLLTPMILGTRRLHRGLISSPSGLRYIAGESTNPRAGHVGIAGRPVCGARIATIAKIKTASSTLVVRDPASQGTRRA